MTNLPDDELPEAAEVTTGLEEGVPRRILATSVAILDTSSALRRGVSEPVPAVEGPGSSILKQSYRFRADVS